MIGVGGGLLSHLQANRRTVMHVVDPFKVPVAEAAEKAVAMQRLGHPALIIASTDYDRFDTYMPDYLSAIKQASGIPLILHFPPRPGVGFPLVANADAIMFPALLNSENDYYVWKSHLETLVTLPRRGITPERCPEPLLSAALTFGADEVTYRVLGTVPVDREAGRLAFLAEVIQMFRFDLVYLYSRFAAVAPQACRFLRDRLRPDQLIFVSGGVRTREQIDAYHEAGADFVAFAGALEHPAWRTTLEQLCPVPSTDHTAGLVPSRARR